MKLSEHIQWEMDRLEKQIKFAQRMEMFNRALRYLSIPVIAWAIYEVAVSL
tara:strand:+ start:435 stop:587 length:153 start_codon:yes stop_codon:yes gene_type:complete